MIQALIATNVILSLFLLGVIYVAFSDIGSP